MKKTIKGLILFFSISFVFLAGTLTYVLATGNAVPFINNVAKRFTPTLVNTQEVEIRDINRIDITNHDTYVTFHSSETDKIVMKEYSAISNDESFITTNQNNETLSIEAAKHPSSFIVLGSNRREVEIYLPSSYQGSLSINANSGDVTATVNLTLKDCTIKSSSGYIDLHSLTAENISFITDSGDIDAKELIGDSKLSTSSGYIDVGTIQGPIIAETNSGDIDIASLMNSQFNLSTSSGYIDIKKGSGEGKMITSSGDIDVLALDCKGDVTLQTSSGYVDITMVKNSQFHFKGQTSSGDMETYFDENIRYNKDGNQAEGSVGDTLEHHISINTSSGDIDIRN